VPDALQRDAGGCELTKDLGSKILQIAEELSAPAVLPEPFDKGVSTAGSRKGLY
jgi:hypothetical protein